MNVNSMESYYYYKYKIDLKIVVIQPCVEKMQLLHDYKNICIGSYNQEMQKSLIFLNERFLKLHDQQVCAGLIKGIE